MRRLAAIAVWALLTFPAAAQRIPGNDNPARLVALGERLERQGELAGAMIFYDRALQFDPGFVSAFRAAAANAMARGADSEAGHYYSTWAGREPRNPEPLVGLASTLITPQRPEEALVLLQRAEDLGGHLGRIAAQRGIAFDLLGDPAAAQRAYAVALDADPGDALTTQRMALSLALSGQDGAALTLMKRFGSEPESAAVRRALALIHALGGRRTDAAELAASLAPIAEARKMRAFYAQLSRLAPRDRAVAVHLGTLPSEARLVAGGGAQQRASARPSMIPSNPQDLRSRASSPSTPPVPQRADEAMTGEAGRSDGPDTTAPRFLSIATAPSLARTRGSGAPPLIAGVAGERRRAAAATPMGATA